LVIAFPVAHWLYRRIGAAPCLVGAALLSSWCILHVWDIIAVGTRLLGDDIPQPAWYYPWIFAPRVSWPVIAGMFLATAPGRSRSPVLAACLGLLLVEPMVVRFIGEGAEVAFTGPLRKQVVMQLLDVPLAVLLLGVLRHARLPAFLGLLLERAGRASWGIYLGHVLVFEMVHLSGRAPEVTDVPYRPCYAVLLLGAGALAAWAGARLREALAGSA
jgi:surface polysaccharide O-acyltransferase-like enzyme